MKKSIILLVALVSSSALYSMEKGKDSLETVADLLAYLNESDDQSSNSQIVPVVKKDQDVKIESPYVKCYFTPDIKNAFLNCIVNEQKGMRGAWYRFTLYDAALAISKAMRQRNVEVGLVIDSDHFKKMENYNAKFKGEFCIPLKLIIDNGGAVYSMETSRFLQNKGHFETMHQKFMIFDNVNGKKLLWTGSWNATGQASLKIANV